MGRPFSKAQVAIGILQFFIWPWFLRYIWVIGWTVLIFIRHFQPPNASNAPLADNNPETGYKVDFIDDSQ